MVKMHYRWYFCLGIKSTVNLDRNLATEPEKTGKQNVEQEMEWETIQILPEIFTFNLAQCFPDFDPPEGLLDRLSHVKEKML